jgi:hypothetical protein
LFVVVPVGIVLVGLGFGLFGSVVPVGEGCPLFGPGGVESPPNGPPSGCSSAELQP